MTLEIEIKFYRMTDRLLDQGPCGAVTTSVFVSFIREESERVSEWCLSGMLHLTEYDVASQLQ